MAASSQQRMLSLPWLLLCLSLMIGQLLLLSPAPAAANDDATDLLKGTQFFRRNAKWINLPSGGGSLVSGRGNFRPGFHSSLTAQSFMAEPLFAVKRSNPVRAFAMFDRDFAGNPMFSAFARRR